MNFVLFLASSSLFRKGSKVFVEIDGKSRPMCLTSSGLDVLLGRDREKICDLASKLPSYTNAVTDVGYFVTGLSDNAASSVELNDWVTCSLDDDGPETTSCEDRNLFDIAYQCLKQGAPGTSRLYE